MLRRAYVLAIAGKRTHGTTREAPIRRFEAVERAALLPLPRTPHELAVWHTAKFHTDTHVVFQKAMYSVDAGGAVETSGVEPKPVWPMGEAWQAVASKSARVFRGPTLRAERIFAQGSTCLGWTRISAGT